jgi:hypothetical protein
MKDITNNTWKYGSLKLSAMTYTFKCDNEKCKKKIVCLLSKYDEREYFGRCSYCNSGRLKWIQNIDLKSILNDANIIYKK